jgi:IclR family transcriptional regulator, KDG regulon repressor
MAQAQASPSRGDAPAGRQRARGAIKSGKPLLAPAGDKTLVKGLHLLEALTESEESRGISELAHSLGLNKSNVHRLLQTLIRCGYAAKERGTERYLLSSKLWRISRRGRPYAALRRLVRPSLRRLVGETGESVVFTIVEDDEMVLIDQVETQNPVRVFFWVGQSFPVDEVLMQGSGLTALQQVALAARPRSEATAAVRKVQNQLRRGEAYVEQELAKLAAVRRHGFALSRGEWVAGVNAAAVPVADEGGELVGVLSCFGPADRVRDDTLARLTTRLRSIATALSQQLCG